MSPEPPPRVRHRFLFVVVVLAAFGLWRLLHRDDRHSWPLPAEPWPDEAPVDPAPVLSSEPAEASDLEAPAASSSEPTAADPLADLARVLSESTERQNGAALRSGVAPAPEHDVPASPPEFEHRYAVKWTDRSQDVAVQHEKRDLTLRQAIRDAGWIAQHSRRFYAGGESARSPFAELRVYLQCLCGRDVPDLTRQHRVPGGSRVCEYSGQGSEQGPNPATLVS